jgi:hypothetical protein
MIYVASSWRNPHYESILDCLEQWALPYYNWRDEAGFHWSEVFGVESVDHWTEPIPPWLFANGLSHSRAQEGFDRDMDHLKEASAVILLLPCGKSAHLEAGWAVGAGKPVALYMPEDLQPELMYGMFDLITGEIDRLMHWAASTYRKQNPARVT